MSNNNSNNDNVSPKVDTTVSKKANGENSNDKKMQGVDIGNPIEFWTAWSERRNLCLEHSETTGQAACTCFEGIGSVM